MYTSNPASKPSTAPGDATTSVSAVLLLKAGGGTTTMTPGSAEMTTTLNTVGDSSTLPARSTPLTFRVMSPCSSDVTSTRPCVAGYTDDTTSGRDRSVLYMTTRKPVTGSSADTFSVR